MSEALEPAVDPFHPLLRIVERYRRDVHLMNPAPGEDVLQRAALHLGHPLPRGLGSFLSRWNGAVLFRGALRIRSASQLASASAAARQVIVFADGPSSEDRWAFVIDASGRTLFGRWHGGRFEPLHDRFERWLIATVRILDEDRHDDHAQLAARRDADPDGPWLLLKEAERHLARGDVELARRRLRRATAVEPDLVKGWQRLGESLRGEDDGASRWAYLKALRTVRLPQPWPSQYGLDAGLISVMSTLFPAGDDGWERELRRFLEERVQDVATAEEQAFVEAAAIALSQVLIVQGRRPASRAVLEALVERGAGFALGAPLYEATLALAEIEADLGHHDSAERRLRLFQAAQGPLSARASLVQGRIVMMRQEPWAEEILTVALRELVHPAHRAEALLLLGERHIRQGELDTAERALIEALQVSRQSGLHALGAGALLGLGDLCRLRGDGAGAQEKYQTARAAAGQSPELLERILVRRGDLFRMVGDDERAAEDYRRAADAFSGLHLPIREGWARIRLAQMQEPGAAAIARELFKAADLAAGVAAADAISGQPGLSLDWHLERAAEHARGRANAQRARPPLTRADADRPERRIGAHRAAIAACQVEIVHSLSASLADNARALNKGRAPARLSDPNLARYVAAIDLLAAHRSYEAAESLLTQLIRFRPQGLARRALIGALSRSPNAALADGLLELLEAGDEPSSLAAAAEILGWRREPAAVTVLRRYTDPSCSPLLRKAAIVALGRIGDREAISQLLPALDEPELSEAAAIALLLLGEWRGLDHQAQALAAQRPNTSRSLGEIVGRYGGPSYLLLLIRTADRDGPAGLGAIQGLGYLGAPRVIERLIDFTASRDAQRARIASDALEILTGHHESADESLLRNRWQAWWEANQGEFRDGQRYRHGQQMSPALLVERMCHDDPLVRRSSYDELVISTGVRQPFDADGPWRVQQAHLARWRVWCREQDEELIGRWAFHGDVIG
ncbi:MAG: HEAT repeat domain-containing protein [Myxococcota bacterium]